MADDLTRAAQALRDSGRALTENEHAERWQHVLVGDSHVVTAGSPWVANCGGGTSARNAARHIALCASYHVSEAITDLLEAIAEAAQNENDKGALAYYAAEVLAAAILRTEEQT